MRTIIAGSRSFNDYDRFEDLLDGVCMFINVTSIISGLAHGADTMALKYAAEADLPVTKYAADWEKFGRAAGPIRNEEMAEVADALVAFWDGESRGTKSMIDLALKKGLVVIVVPVEATEV